MDVWKIGVEIALVNHMSPVLSSIAADLLGLKGKAGEVEQAFSAWKPALAGALGIVAGGAILEGMGKLIDHGQELVHVQQQMAAAGIGTDDIASATAESWKVAADYGLKVSDVLADIKEARLVFGSTEHAQEYVSELEKMRVVMNAMHEGSGTNAVHAVYEASRAGELKSLVNPADFVNYFDQMTKVVEASGGKIDANAYMQATQYGRLASKGWDTEFATRYLPSLIQELGPSGAGTALMSLYGTIGQGKVSKRSLEMMDDIGLIADPSKLVFDKQGNAKGAKPGAFADTPGFVLDPFLWSQNTLMPLIEKKIGHKAGPGDSEAIELLGGMFGNRMSAQAISTMLLEHQRIEKDAGLIGMAPGVSAADQLLANDPKTVQKNFTDSWDNMLTALGSPLVPLSITAMNSVTDVVKSLTSVAAAHPEAIKIVGEAVIGLGAALVGLGAAAVIGAAAALIPGGMIAVAVVAIGGVIASIVKFNWQGVKTALTGVYDAIADFIAKIASIPAMITHALGIGGAGPARPYDRAPAPTWQAPSGGRGVHPSSWVPPSGGAAPQPIHTAVNIDGRTIARAVSYHMAANSPGNTGSSSFDGRSMWAPTDVSSI